MNVAVLGSSHICRMDQTKTFLQGITETRYFGKRGGPICDMYVFLTELLDFSPMLVFMQIGGNDIRENTPPERLVES